MFSAACWERIWFWRTNLVVVPQDISDFIFLSFNSSTFTIKLYKLKWLNFHPYHIFKWKVQICVFLPKYALLPGTKSKNKWTITIKKEEIKKTKESKFMDLKIFKWIQIIWSLGIYQRYLIDQLMVQAVVTSLPILLSFTSAAVSTGLWVTVWRINNFWKLGGCEFKNTFQNCICFHPPPPHLACVHKN